MQLAMFDHGIKLIHDFFSSTYEAIHNFLYHCVSLQKLKMCCQFIKQDRFVNISLDHQASICYNSRMFTVLNVMGYLSEKMSRIISMNIMTFVPPPPQKKKKEIDC